jgi:hypothetical protein
MTLFTLLQMVPAVDWKVAFDSFFVSHIYFGNWSFLQLRWWIYHSYLYLALFAALGFPIFAWRHFGRNRGQTPESIGEGAVLILAMFYLTFGLGIAYHVLVTFATGSGSSTCGWYAYCVVIAELSVAYAGAKALLPSRLHPWILPSLTACFALLDLYATHMVLIPYYTGLIAHNPNGALATFQVGQYSREGIGLAVNRLLEFKPWIWNAATLMTAWSAFVMTTVANAVIAFRPQVILEE